MSKKDFPLTVDVIIPVYRPDERLFRLLRLMREQSYQVDKIIIMHTGTPSGEIGRLAKDNNVEIHNILPEEFDHGATRNTGAMFSDADIVLFMTQDAVPYDNQMVAELLRPFLNHVKGRPKIAVSYARQLPDKDCGPIEVFTRGFNYPPESRLKTKEDIPQLGIKTFFASNVCAAYPRELFVSRGGFINRTIFNEDMIYSGQAVIDDYAVFYAAKARVVHSHRYTCRQQFHRNFDLGVSQADNPHVFGSVKSESEGKRLIMLALNYLKKGKKWLQIPYLFVMSGFKYLGYLLGKNYKKLPSGLVRCFSLNKRYWNVK